MPSVPETSVATATPSSNTDQNPSDMTGASKELSPEKVSNEQFVDARPIDEGIIASVYSFAKKAATVGKLGQISKKKSLYDYYKNTSQASFIWWVIWDGQSLG